MDADPNALPWKFAWDEAKNESNFRKHGIDCRCERDVSRPAGCGPRHVLRLFVSSHWERRAAVNAKNTKRRSRTDSKRVDALRDSDIDFSEMPELGPDFFARAILWPGPKKQITLRLDPDVLAFFRKHGKGYQTTINAVLRKYVEGRKARVS
jgi:uncharacterized protein (DUF4415 family)